MKKLSKNGGIKIARKTQYRPTVRKAVEGSAGYPQAMYIWKKLEVDKFQFSDPRAYTLEKISILTWIDCKNSADYQRNKGFYKNLARGLIKYWRGIDPRCKVIIIYDKTAKNGVMESKVCRSDRTHAIKRVHHMTNIAAGCMAGATEMNDRLKLGQDLGKAFMQQVVQRLPNHYSDKDKKKIATQFLLETAMEAGKQVGKKEIAMGVLTVLDEKPALKAKDQEMNDKFSQDANNRRNKNKG